MLGRSNMNRGFIALISILIISALIVLISVGVSLRSIGETNMALDEQEAHRALALADLCSEQALINLINDINYSGGETITVGDESCDIVSVDGVGNEDRIVKTESIVSGYTKKIKVEVAQISPTTTTVISSWEEVADF